MKLKRLAMLVPIAISLQAGICFSQEHEGSFAQAAMASGGANSWSMSPGDLTCRLPAGEPAVATHHGEVDRTKPGELRTTTSREHVADEEELGRETYRMILSGVALLLFLYSRRNRGGWA